MQSKGALAATANATVVSFLLLGVWIDDQTIVTLLEQKVIFLSTYIGRLAKVGYTRRNSRRERHFSRRASSRCLCVSSDNIFPSTRGRVFFSPILGRYLGVIWSITKGETLKKWSIWDPKPLT